MYDPRVKYGSSDQAEEKSIVWCTQNVEWALESVNRGMSLKRSPFHEGNPELRKGDIVFSYSEEELLELAKCQKSILYFCNYVRTKDKYGQWTPIKLYPFQLKQLVRFTRSKSHILCWSRQASKTTTVAIFMLWLSVCFPDKRSAILGNKGPTSKEVVSRVQAMYKILPFWLKPGVTGWNGGSLNLDNGSSVITRACTMDALNGVSVNGTLLLDEFAFTFDGQPEKQKEFLANAMPVLSSFVDSKLVIASTPKGYNYFYELYDNAIKGLNSYLPSTIFWWQIPGRSLEWALEVIGEIGYDMFKVQFELSFDVTIDRLLDPVTLQKLNAGKTVFNNGDDYDFAIVEAYPESFRFKDDTFTGKKFYVHTVDISEGLGADYTVNQIFELKHKIVKDKAYIYFEQVMVFHDNKVSVEAFSVVVRELFSQVFESDNCRFLYESNTYGDHFKKCILEDEEEEDGYEGLDTEMILKFKRSQEAKTGSMGLRTNTLVKKLAVSAFKACVSSGTFIIQDEKTIAEIEKFGADKKGNFKAEVGHDDLVIPIVNLAFALLSENTGLKELIEDYLEHHGIENDWTTNAKAAFTVEMLKKAANYLVEAA